MATFRSIALPMVCRVLALCSQLGWNYIVVANDGASHLKLRDLDAKARESRVLVVTASLTAIPSLVVAKYQASLQNTDLELRTVDIAATASPRACQGLAFWRDWLGAASEGVASTISRALSSPLRLLSPDDEDVVYKVQNAESPLRSVSYRGLLTSRLHTKVKSPAIATLHEKYPTLRHVTNVMGLENRAFMVIGGFLTRAAKLGKSEILLAILWLTR